mgnify:CR=1 FL=1
MNSQENQAINLISKAWTLFIDGNIEKARNLLENSFFPETAYPIRYFLSGKIYTKLGLMDEAIDAFQKLVQLEPNRELNHNLLGTAWLKIGENDNALNSFRKAVAIEPDYPDAYFNLALIYDKFKDGNKALSNLLLAQKLYLKRKNQNLYSLTSQLIEKWGSRYELNRKEIDKKLPTVDEIVELSKINMLKNRVRLSPKNIYWRQRLGMAFIKRSDFKSAISEFKNSIQLFPQNAIAYSHLGFSWFRLENYEMARQSFKKAIKINPKLAMSHFNLGATMDILGDGTFAIKHTKVALKLLESENKKRAIEIANANAQLVQLYKKYGRNPEKSLTKKSFDNLK